MPLIKQRKVLFALVSLLLGVIPRTVFSSCQTETAAWRHMQISVVELLNSRQQRILLSARIADDPEERAAGFQNICPPQFQDNAILFLFASPLQARFHMRNVYAPLDIAFFDNDGNVVKIMTMRPASWEKNGQSRLYGPTAVFRSALETRVGYFKEQGIEEGNSQLLYNKLGPIGD